MTDKDRIGRIPWPEDSRHLAINLPSFSAVYHRLLIMVIPTRKDRRNDAGRQGGDPAAGNRNRALCGESVKVSTRESDRCGSHQAAKSMGPHADCMKVLLPGRSLHCLLGAAVSVTTICLFGRNVPALSEAAVGDIAIRIGYYRYRTEDDVS